MSTNIRDWLAASMEERKEDDAPVIVQDGETPKEDFSTAVNDDGGDVDTDKPAVAEIDAASDDYEEGKDIDQGHQEVHVPDNDGKVSNEDAVEDESAAEDATPATEERAEGEEEAPATEEHGEGEEATPAVEDADAETSEASAEAATEAHDDETPATEGHAEESSEKAEEEPATEEHVEEPATEEHAETEAAEETPATESAASTDETPAQEARSESDEDTVSQEEKKDDIDAEDDEGEPKAPTEDKVIEPDSQTDADVEKPVVAKLDEPEAGDDQKTPESDDQVDPDTKGTPVNEVSSEEHVAGDETDVTPAAADPDGIDEEVQHIAKVESDIDHFQDVSESLEAYYGILARGMETTDGVHGDTAEAIRLGIERLDPMFQDADIIPAMEAFGQISSRHTATYISMETVNDNIKTVMEATKRAIAKLFELLYELWTKVTGGVARTRIRVKKLAEQLDNLKGDASVQTQVSGSARLTIGTQFMGNDPRGLAAIEDVAEYIYQDYPRIALGIASDTAQLFEKIPLTPKHRLDAASKQMNAAVEDAVADFVKIPKKYLTKLPNQTTAEQSELPPKLRKVSGVQRSHRLPGNYAVVQYISERTGSAKEAMLNFGDLFNVAFIALEGASGAQKTETYRVPSVREMTEITKRTTAVLDQINKGDANKKAYKDAKQKLEKTSEIIDAKVNMPHLSNPLVRSLNGMARTLTQPSGAFNGYVVGTLNSYLSVLEHNVNVLAKEVGTKSDKTVNGEGGPTTSPATA